jgi:ubiquinone/menaquinone biosynthesis C-methylase UbiE
VTYGDVVALKAEGSRRFYDRFGRWQDAQRFYEDPAIHRLVQAATLERAESVFELGCGTGRLAAELLTSILPSTARYLGVDVSSTMVALSTARIGPWSERATVQLLDPPAVELPGASGAYDRFVATYVFDLLSVDDARALVAEAGRLLAPDGLLAVVSLTRGTTPVSRIVAAGWKAVAARWPTLVGGCRPIELRQLVEGARWHVEHAEVIVRWGVPSEVLVARRGAL